MERLPRVHVLACGVLAADLKVIEPKIAAKLTFEFLPGKLHNVPNDLRRRLQEKIDAISASGEVDFIAIGYGVCGRGTVGLHARNVPLRLPKTHDCIALFLGSDAAYSEQFGRHPGTYYVSSGWVQEGMGSGSAVVPDSELREGADGTAIDKVEAQPGDLAKQYGDDNALAIRDFMGSWKRNYTRAAFIDTGIGNKHHAKLAQQMAEEYGWNYEPLQGSHDVLAAVLTPTPDPRVLEVSPGYITDFNAIERTICARPPRLESVGDGEAQEKTRVVASAGGSDKRSGLGLGIDAGGTYTDAAIFNFDTRKVIAKAKSPTTHWDYAIGISGALDLLPSELLRQVKDVSVSTTLATNAIVEGKGQKVGLLLMPPAGGNGADSIKHKPLRIIAGRLAIDGEELVPADLDGAVRAAEEMVAGDQVRAFAVTGYASSINPAHELAVMEAVRKATGLPVTCGHEVSALLDYRVRAETAALNARIIPYLESFLQRLHVSLYERGITGNVMVVRSDGSLMNVQRAAERPVETLLSGPAASVAGARFMCDAPDALVLDIGGTTSDTAVVADGVVRSDPNGARVGQWRTHVRALAVRTVGLGGDSEVWRDKEGWRVGPRRIWPVCRLAEVAGESAAEQCLAWVERHPDSEASLHAIYALMPDSEIPESLDQRSKGILATLAAGPMAVGELMAKMEVMRASFMGLEALQERQLVRRFGFTPTDALHVLGEMSMWNREYAVAYAAVLGVGERVDAVTLARRVIERAEYRLAETLLLARLAEMCDGREINGAGEPLAAELLKRGLGNAIDGLGVSFDLGVPVVGIGAPASFLLPGAGKRLNTEVVVPQDGDVANAVGAVTSRVRVEHRVSIVPDELGQFHVSGLPGAPVFAEMPEAQSYAEGAIEAWVRRLAAEAGAEESEVTIFTDDRITEAADGVEVFVSRTIMATALGKV
ncbi:MAG: DUF1638 domain-containing protein [Lentisphaerae bacterium]|nr:DUF1638 domain-containing protein [Lentisphaerota bacterium]